ncbi:2OG-Fe(II)-dependent halogenase WelO5 family protein [Streptomyces anulatus]|uniref:2OG-Fe(II)-dependent halogenase WelO5 family protein n=1 Tax=Streptomyces anulatus TaxID=1892 RepID=UPI0036405990
MPASWNRVVHRLDQAGEPAPDGPGVLKGLVNGDHAVVVLRGLLPPEEFDAQRERVVPLFGRAATTEYSNGSLTTLGPFLAKHLAQPDQYFEEAVRAEERTSAVGFDLADRVRARLAGVLGLNSFEAAVEPDGRAYAKKNVRIYSDGVRTPLHNDNMMRDAAGTGLLLAGLRHHLSVVVCVQECDGGGELEIHRKKWEPADEHFKVVGGLGYDDAVTGDAPRHRFKPQTGDVYLLNPTHYHSIEKPTGTDRVTMGFFFGFFDDALSDAIAWV